MLARLSILAVLAAGCAPAAIDPAAVVAADAAVDASPPLDVPADVSCGGAPGCPCTSDEECKVGACVDFADGTRCGIPCTDNENCKPGEDCVSLRQLPSVCFSRHTTLCSPCVTEADCRARGPMGNHVCAAIVPGIYLCSSVCASDEGCPDGFVCDPKLGACKPISGICTCSPWAVDHGASVTCGLGPCAGNFSCSTSGQTVVCDGPQPVTETCNGKDDNCDGLIDVGAKCDDGDACTIDGFCVKGSCSKPKGKLTCKGGDICNHSSCDKIKGCVLLPESCDDGNTCSLDACTVPNGCTHTSASGGTCSDGDSCSIGDHCVGLACVAQLMDCDDGLACTRDFCTSALSCLHVISDSCEDGNNCTTESCGPGGSCVHSMNSGPCADGNECLSGDKCLNGKCIAGTTPVICDDANPCTSDACDLASGCTVVNIADGSTCTDGCGDTSACATGWCLDATKKWPDAWGNWSCESAGVCKNMPAGSCSDGDPLTVDGCNAAHNGCWHVPKSCDDGNECTIEKMNADGSCSLAYVATGTACEVAGWCQVGVCSAVGFCSIPSVKGNCDDGDACTIDACLVSWYSSASCTHIKGFAGNGCDDGNPCTIDGCSPVTGCSHVQISDGSPCNGDCGGQCMAGVCKETDLVGAKQLPQGHEAEHVLALADGFLTWNEHNYTHVRADLIRHDTLGNTLWVKEVVDEGGSPQVSHALLCPAENGFFLTTQLFDPVSQKLTETAIRRLDSTGNTLWKKPLILPPEKYTNVLLADQVGPVVGTFGYETYVVQQLDMAGDPVWSGTYPADKLGAQYFPPPLVLSPPGFALTRNDNRAVSQLDAQGEVMWTKEFTDLIPGVGGMPDGFLLLTVPKFGFNQLGTFHRYLANGTEAWHTTLAVPDEMFYESVPTPLVDGGVAAGFLGFLVRFDAFGNVVFAKSYPDLKIQFGRLVAAPTGFAFCQDKTLHFVDSWGNANCTSSGPCATKGMNGCSDGNPCTIDRCDAAHGGCWHIPLGDGAVCGIGKTCGATGCN